MIYRRNSARQILAQPVLELIFFVNYLGPLPLVKSYGVLSPEHYQCMYSSISKRAEMT